MRSKVFISGAAGGLGKAFAVECARRGWDLFLTDLNSEQLEILAAALRRTYGIHVLYKECNLMDPDSRQELFLSITSGSYRFRGLINVAGLDVEGMFRERSRDDIRGIVRLNVEGTLEVTHSLLEIMDPMQSFWIITVSSLAAFFPIPVKATYAASKRFLLDFSLALRDEVKAQGVTVTVLCPAGLPTTSSAVEGIEAQGLMGQLTTQNIGYVARRTLDQALRGKSIVVPGFLNQVMRYAGSLVPPVVLSGLIGKRWRAARKNREDLIVVLE
ncbi:MAG: SDR family NAD(P)-dependent oxidoreductase [Anaerolineales bacterium]|nr:SDR family NAD(P)-dependent oxidoreductase [Anaerolineales bacterium]